MRSFYECLVDGFFGYEFLFEAPVFLLEEVEVKLFFGGAEAVRGSWACGFWLGDGV